ncbi:MAG: hypothetical protein U0U46_04550 [Saprospiraceae bacterium]
MLSLKLMYGANILVAGWISITTLFFPKTAQTAIFTDGFVYSEAFRLIGALWGAIFLLSVAGLFYPDKMSVVLLFQLVYKSCWLLFAALPAVIRHEPFPKSMAIFFLAWVLVLPFVIPWHHLFKPE